MKEKDGQTCLRVGVIGRFFRGLRMVDNLLLIMVVGGNGIEMEHCPPYPQIRQMFPPVQLSPVVYSFVVTQITTLYPENTESMDANLSREHHQQNPGQPLSLMPRFWPSTETSRCNGQPKRSANVLTTYCEPQKSSDKVILFL